MTDLRSKDFTPGGLKIEGAWENDRNADYSELYKSIIRETCDVKDVIIAHHLVFVNTEVRDGFEYQVIEEIPSADTLIFNHDIAAKLWGTDYKKALVKLACEPVATRDDLLAEFYADRTKAVADPIL